MLAAFQKLIDCISSDTTPNEAFEELVEIRSDFALRYAFKGFNLDYTDALELIKKKEGLTKEEDIKRNILVAAVENIIDFATVEEYHAVVEAEDELEDEAEDYSETPDEVDEDDRDEIIFGICSKYNKQYASVENYDIEYAMIVAAELAAINNDSWLMYMTMGDERVRPWHLQYEGYSAPKSSFPAWLVPPIEHACRCYLVEDDKPSASLAGVQNQAVQLEPPYWFNRTFKESVAFGGRIFSDEHPYFSVDLSHKEFLERIARNIKSKYFDGKDNIPTDGEAVAGSIT